MIVVYVEGEEGMKRQMILMLLGLICIMNCSMVVIASSADVLTQVTQSELSRSTDFVVDGITLENYTGSDAIVQIPQGITVIGESAFKNNEFVEQVILPEKLDRIESSAFEGCCNLKEINLENVDSMGDAVFRDCVTLKAVNITGISSMGRYMFENCKALTTVDLADEYPCIQESMFRNCTSLKEISFSKGLKEIARYAFYGCSSLESIYWNDNVTLIQYEAFKDCTSLKEVVLPESLAEVESNIFEGCTGIETVTVSSDFAAYGTGFGKYYLFKGCSSLTEVILKEQVTAIPIGMFMDCTSLSEFVIPSHVTDVGREAFHNTALQSITVKNDDIYIAEEAFWKKTEINHEFLIRANEGSNAQAFAYMQMIQFETIDGSKQWDYNDSEKGSYEATSSAHETALALLDEIYIEKHPGMALEYEYGTPEDRGFFVELSKSIIDENSEKSELQAIYDWVNDNIGTAGYRTYFYPMDVYRTKCADCNGNAELLCELYRCAGIPAVIAVGFAGDMNNVITTNDLILGLDVGHAWVYVYWNNQWCVADTGLNNLYTDKEDICSQYYVICLDRNFLYHPYMSMASCDGACYRNGEIIQYSDGDLNCPIGSQIVTAEDWGSFWYREDLKSLDTNEIISNRYGNEGWGTGGLYSFRYLKRNSWVRNAAVLEIEGKRYYFERQHGVPFEILDDEEWGLFGGLPHIKVGQTIKLEPVILSSDGEYSIKFVCDETDTDNTDAFTINEDNSLTCNEAGVYTIDVVLKETNGNEYPLSSLALYGYEPMEELRVSNDALTVDVNSEIILDVVATPANYYDMPYILKSSDESIAQVYYTERGITVVGRADGKTTITITATDGSGTSTTCEVTVGNQECNHVEVIDEAVLVTCTENGLTEGIHCSVCNEVLQEQEVILSQGHQFSKEWTVDKEASCTLEGSKSHHCTRENCMKKIEVTVIPIVEHAWNDGEVTTKATCTEKGETTYTCTNCPATKTEEIVALEHEFSEEWTVDKEASCTLEGSKSHHCTRENCMEKTDVTEISATGQHTYDSGVVTKGATCTEKGQKVYTCTSCGIMVNETIPATGFVKGGMFNEGNNTYTIKAVKGKKGTVVYEGSVKNNQKTVKIPKTVKIKGKTYTITEVGDKAFKGKTKLKSVSIPEGVTKIGEEAFSGCKNLKTITIKSTKLKSVGKNAIKNIDKNATIKVPKKQYSKYKKLFKSSTGYKKTIKVKK